MFRGASVAMVALRVALVWVAFLLVAGYLWTLRDNDVDPECNDYCSGDRELEAIVGVLLLGVPVVAIAVLVIVVDLAIRAFRRSRG